MVEDENQMLSDNCRKYECAIETLNKEKQALDKKCAQVRTLIHYKCKSKTSGEEMICKEISVLFTNAE